MALILGLLLPPLGPRVGLGLDLLDIAFLLKLRDELLHNLNLELV